MRTKEQLLHHYQVEKELAEKLKAASSEERASLYSAVYDEMFRRVPDHPMLINKAGDKFLSDERAMHLNWITPLLNQELNFLEVGPGDCRFSIKVAGLVKSVTAVDVSEEISAEESFPANMKLAISDGVSIPVDADSIDLAYSNQLMEHLHPDDAWDQLSNIFRSLKPGGKYVCITPNRYTGPHDISQFFSNEAEGFHLKEYTIRELSTLLKKCGFREVEVVMFAKRQPSSFPLFGANVIETMLALIPGGIRSKVANLPVLRNMMGINLIATK